MAGYTSAYVVVECADCDNRFAQPISVTDKEAAKEVGALMRHGHFCPGPADEFLDIGRPA